jgi:hypothetical protein
MSNWYVAANLSSLTRIGLFGLTLSIAAAQPATIITFDVPGAGTSFRQGTTATSINTAGDIAGFYVDSSNADHGFIRSRDGVFTVFDAPGATSGTLPYGINDAGDVTGYCFDAEFIAHGFVRSAAGVMTTFEIPVSGGSGTYAFSINDVGAVAGFYFQDGESFSFIRDPFGSITIFVAAPGGPGLNGTRASSINNVNGVTGFYSNADLPQHGFVREPSGFTRTFRAPDAGTSNFQGTNATSINDAGAITGDYIDSAGHTLGFVRSPEGLFTEFSAPGANAATLPAGINEAGTIAGSYSIGGLSVGFLRSPSGGFTSFAVPGAGGAAYTGTFPAGINGSGVVAGYFIDANSVDHGFLRTPGAQ